MRVVLLVTDLERGGTPLRLAALARSLKGAGIEASVGCLAPAGPVSSELDSDEVATFACRARSAADLFALRRLAEHLRRMQPDLIHATLTHANVAARIVGDWLRIPVITSTATIEIERPWHLALERCTAGMDLGHLVHSQALAAHVAEAFHLSAERIYVVPPSLATLPRRTDRGEARRRFGLPEDAFVVAWAGRFDPVKRLDLAIRCVEKLTELRCHLLLAGDGAARPWVAELARRSSASQRIHLLGWQSDLGPALSAADAFVFPSLTEGMPNAVLQAMALGLPIVGSNIPAMRELAGDEIRLLLVDGHDHGKYAAVLRHLHENDEMRREVGRRAAAWARTHLSQSEAVRATIAVYQRVCRFAN